MVWPEGRDAAWRLIGPACTADAVLVAHAARSGRTVTPVQGGLHQHIAMNWRRAAWIALFIFLLSKAWGQWEHRATSPVDGVLAPNEPLQTDANRAVRANASNHQTAEIGL